LGCLVFVQELPFNKAELCVFVVFVVVGNVFWLESPQTFERRTHSITEKKSTSPMSILNGNFRREHNSISFSSFLTTVVVEDIDIIPI